MKPIRFYAWCILAVLGSISSALAGLDVVTPAEKSLFVGGFSQCSYNAMGSVLTYFYGPRPTPFDRKEIEKEAFLDPVEHAGMGAYYGWGPWTSFMADSGQIKWAGKNANDLHASRFSLATARLPVVIRVPNPKQNSETADALPAMRVVFAPGERTVLRQRLWSRLQEGPVIVWIPYAAHLTPENPWKHVLSLSESEDEVLFHPYMTHSVTLFPRKDGKILVCDGSVKDGIFVVDPDVMVSTAAAMSASIRIADEQGSSIFSRGLSGIQNDEFEVVFRRGAAGSPATQRSESLTPDELSRALAQLPEPLRKPTAESLGKAPEHATRWLSAIRNAPDSQRMALAYLLAGMPRTDLYNLDENQLLAHINLAFKTRMQVPWGKDIPEEIFLDAVLPYANLNETREKWRERFTAELLPVVAQCQTPGQAALLLNEKIYPMYHVAYHPTRRPRPDQSPAESIAAGYASCSGLSIMLVDACRAVGVPARVVGTPQWVVRSGDANGNHSGNHTWVEIWDGQWRILGASEVSPLDQVWFLNNASLAADKADRWEHRIYATTWKNSAEHFPMVWDLANRDTHADLVTADYANRIEVQIKPVDATGGAVAGQLALRRDGLLIAVIHYPTDRWLTLSANQTYDAVFSFADGQKSTSRIKAPTTTRTQLPLRVSQN